MTDVSTTCEVITFRVKVRCIKEGDVKEPVTLFEKSRGRRPRCHGLTDLCRHRSGWARCDQNMD